MTEINFNAEVRSILDNTKLSLRRRKDVTPHHIPQPEVMSMQEILDAADRAGADSDLVIDHYRYLRDVDVQNDDVAGRLRHRATLMRQRADQFDQMADKYREACASLESAVRSYDELSIRILRTLEEHKHVEPTKDLF